MTRDAFKLLCELEVARIRMQTRGPKNGPCVLCGKPGVRHHPSYLRPQETFFMCPRDHVRLHARLKKRGRSPVHLYHQARLAGAPCPREGISSYGYVADARIHGFEYARKKHNAEWRERAARKAEQG